jgi:hypothetical protein
MTKMTAILLICPNLAGVAAVLALTRSWIPSAPGAGVPNIMFRRMYDGSVVQYRPPLFGGQRMPVVVQPPSATGLCHVWWPLAASTGTRLLTVRIWWFRSRR